MAEKELPNTHEKLGRCGYRATGARSTTGVAVTLTSCPVTCVLLVDTDPSCSPPSPAKALARAFRRASLASAAPRRKVPAGKTNAPSGGRPPSTS